MAPELFYLHGMGGSPADWQPVAGLLPGPALALPAQAKSPVACAAGLAQTILAARRSPFALCGYSMGGRLSLLATELLLARGKAPSHLILVSTGLGDPSPEGRARRLELDEEWAALAERDPEEFWCKWYKQAIFASFQALPAETRLKWLSARKTIDIADLVSQLRCLGPARHGDLFPMLEGVARKGISVLYIVGEQDKKYVELSQKVKEIPGVSVEVLPRAGHILPLEAPAELAARLRAFLS